MSAKSSPGPWRATPHSMNASAAIEIEDAAGNRVATISISDNEGPNAALIASAPEQQAKIELVADALEVLLADVYNDGEDDCLSILVTPDKIESARAALRRAGRLP